MTLTAYQLELRRDGITATDVPAILGVHPHKSAVNVWEEKLGIAPPHDPGPRAKWGTLLEPLIRNDYGERHGLRIVAPRTREHYDYPHHLATPDGLCYRGRELVRGLECKMHTVFLRGEYGTPGTDEIPAHELLQAAWGLHVVDECDEWALVPFIDGQPTDYLIRRDRELEEMLCEAVDRFWTDHVLAKVPPRPDGTKQYSEWLASRYPMHRDDSLTEVEQGSDLDTVFRELRSIRESQGHLAKERAMVEQRIKASMGSSEGFRFPALDGSRKTERITWRKAKDSTRTDWEAVAIELAGQLGLVRSSSPAPATELVQALRSCPSPSDVIARHTTTTPGSRSLCVPRSWDKE